MQRSIQYLRSLEAVRERSTAVCAKAKTTGAGLIHFEPVDWTRLQEVVAFVESLIRRDYASPRDVPAHSRWRHFDVGNHRRIHNVLLPALNFNLNVNNISNATITANNSDALEATRSVLDLFVVSVLLDAGAGDVWKYREERTGETYGRSEGLAVASLDMFMAGAFSSDPTHAPLRVDAEGLRALTVDRLKQGFQVSPSNPMVGLEGRCALLVRLGECLRAEQTYFPAVGAPNASAALPRPGNLLDFLLRHPTTAAKPAAATGTSKTIVKMDTLWEAVMEGFKGVWPSTRTTIGGVSLGDVWPCEVLLQGTPAVADGTEHLVPFHKLSQWLTYSLMEPMSLLLGIHIDGLQKMTGLPEYRNGGLFVDFGVLTLKPAECARGLEIAVRHAAANVKDVPMFEPSDPVIIEWRAMTVALLDIVGEQVRAKFGLSEEEMPLVKVLEGGTWKAGREIAAKKRPVTRGPPIQILSDGTVF